MRKHYKAVFPFIALLCFFAPFSARATHVMGADIEWKCLGNDSFELIVHAYRDCNGIQLTGTNLTYQTTGDTCVTTPVNANPDVCCGTDVTPICPGMQDACNSPGNTTFPYGIEEFTITAIVYLPPPCCNYTIAWYESARNSAITTGAANKDFYDEVYLNRCAKPCVSSPYFTIPPVAMYCVNQCIVYNPGVDDDSRDAEGRADSLSYSFGRPQSAQGNFISYTPPYSYDAPLIYAGKSKDQPFVPPYCYGFHLDSTTGDIEFKATKTDITIMVVIVSIYRRDSLGIERKIGQISRDLQIMIVNCPTNRPPIIPGIDGGNSYSEKICADRQTCFKVLAFDLDPPDSVKLGWNNPPSMVGATFQVIPDGKKWPTANFCWYPTDKDVRSYPYTFIAMAVDNACDPLPGRSSKAFNIYVIAAPSALYHTTNEGCGLVDFNATPAPNSATSITKYLWTGEGAPGYGPLYILGRSGSYQYTRGGTYHYNLIVSGPNGCTRSYTDSVVIPKFAGISLGPDTTVCNDKPTLTFTATLVNALKPYQIWWSTLKDANGDSITTASITEKITKDTAFRVNIHAQGCSNYDSVKVHVNPLPQPNAGPDQRGCWGHPILLTTGLKHEPKVTWTWILPKDTQRNAFRGDSIHVIDSGLYVVTVQDSIGCPGTSSANVYFNPPVKANQVDSTVCVGATVTLRAGIGGAGASYQWMDRIHNNRIVANTPTYQFTANAQSGYGVQADLEMVIKNTGHGVTCVDTGYYNIKVNTPTHPKLTPPPTMCVTDPPLELQAKLVDVLHQGGNWIYPRKPSAVVNNFIYPSIMGETDNNPSLGWIHYIYVDGFKCVTNDSVKVVIVTKPVVTAGRDTEICTANGRYMLNLLGGSPAGGQWLVVSGPKNALQYSKNLDSVFFNPNVEGITNGVYQVSYSYHDPKGPCSNTATIKITVTTNPTVTVPVIDSLCNSSFEQPLYATPSAGTWAIDDNYTPAGALVYHSVGNYYGFVAGAAGTAHPWHYLKYTVFGDRQNSLCPSVMRDSVYVWPAPQNPDFHTDDNSWEYCDDHASVILDRTVNGVKTTAGEFSTANGVTTDGKDWLFSPRNADSSQPNTVTFILPYDKGQCHVQATHTIKVDSHPFVSILSSPNLCWGPNSFEIKALRSNANKIVWSGLGSFKPITPPNDSTDVDYFPTLDQLNLSYSFQVMVKDTNTGVCPAHVSVADFTIYQPPVVKFSSNRAGCEPLPVKFNSDSSSVAGVSNSSVIKSYDWDFGDGSAHSQDPNPIHVYKVTNGKDTQQFSVTLREVSDSGCVGTLVKTNWITAYATPRPVIAANPQFTTIAMPQVQFTLDPRSSGIDFNDPNTTYKWTFGENNSPDNTSNLRSPMHSYGDTGAFKVRVAVTSKGCTGDTLITVYVQPELIIYIPNVFKPDNHHPERNPASDAPNYYSAEVNNTFQPVISAYQSFQMSIYNRWGQLMYTTADPNKGWTGWFEGHEPLQDVYVYVIKATGYSGKPYTFTGTVTLVY